jgi:HSP20 family protein
MGAAGTAEMLVPVIPPIETWIDAEDKRFHLTMPLPGIKPQALNITLQGNRLTFSGEQKEEEDNSKKSYLEREYSYQHFVRTITLPNGVEGDKLTAELNDGILELTAPIADSALPKKIEIKDAAAKSAAKAAGK